MIEFYLGEKPILNNVPTYMCRETDDLEYVLDHLPELVVKEVHGAGGYGMLVGPAATKAEIDEFRAVLEANPANYIAQPTLSLSTCPTFVESGIAPRHIDLRPFVLSGKTVQMVPGGLTRVALKDGSLVVNSSQGGGTKDTWVLREREGGMNDAVYEPPTICSGWPATWSGPKTLPACSTSTTRPRCCRSRPTWPKQGWRGLLSISELTPVLPREAQGGQCRAMSWTSWCATRAIRRASSAACARRARTRAPCAAR